MTRGYWGGVMLFSLVITGAAGWYLSTALMEKKTVKVPLTRVEKVEKPVPVTTPLTTAVPIASPSSPAAVPTDTTETAKKGILFSFKSPSAKKVFVIGSFNKWFRQPMTKKGHIWTFTVELEPGTYEYKFVVDNKRIKDPNNKIVSKLGNSILNVKPASES